MPNTYTVTVELVGEGKAPETFEVTAGGSNTFEVEPADGWKLTGVTVDNKNAKVAFNGNKVTVSNVQGDVTVTVTLTQMEYDVTLNIEGDGTVNRLRLKPPLVRVMSLSLLMTEKLRTQRTPLNFILLATLPLQLRSKRKHLF